VATPFATKSLAVQLILQTTTRTIMTYFAAKFSTSKLVYVFTFFKIVII